MSISTYKLTVFGELKVKPEPVPCSDMHMLHSVAIPDWRRGGRGELLLSCFLASKPVGGLVGGWFVGTRNLNNENIKTSMGWGEHVSLGENVEGINLNYRQLTAIVPMSVGLHLGLRGRRKEMRSRCWER